MRKITKSDREWLEANWLPKLYSLPQRRKGIRLLIIAMLISGWIVCTVIALSGFFSTGGFRWEIHCPALFVCLGFTAICVRYFATIQLCDDELLIIDLAVRKGDWDALNKSIGKLTCYKRFKNILNDVKDLRPE